MTFQLFANEIIKREGERVRGRWKTVGKGVKGGNYGCDKDSNKGKVSLGCASRMLWRNRVMDIR